MGLENIPQSGTREDLEKIGARHFQTDDFEIEGKRVHIEIMGYEDDKIAVVWKKPVNGNKYLLHTELKVERKYPVPVVIKPANQPYI